MNGSVNKYRAAGNFSTHLKHQNKPLSGFLLKEKKIGDKISTYIKILPRNHKCPPFGKYIGSRLLNFWYK